MVELTRTVRFSINPATAEPTPVHNSFAGHPSMQGLGRHYELHVTCRGTADEQTGYFLNIKEIDRAVRAAAIPRIDDACRDRPNAEPSSLMPELLNATAEALPVELHAIRWNLTPYYSIEMTITDASHVLLRQQFDFAASHRLHVPSMTDEENLATFGKCNNPHGHGHNYRVEVCARIPLDDPNALHLATLEALVDKHLIDRFDHKNLNLDCEEFTGDLNPSVENIAKVSYDILATALAHSPHTGDIASVTIWETDKTRCTYPA